MAKLKYLDPLVRDIEPAVKDLWVQDTIYGDLVKPERLPKPSCKVWLVCGPPASGKSTFIRKHASLGDIIIDLDTIAREYGMSRERPAEATAMLLMDRNERLAALASEAPQRVAWVILGGASEALRQWWCETLGVELDRLIVLLPSREELYQRIMNDPDRRTVRHLHMQLVDKWFAQDNA